ncbi:hypothetical protein L1887_54141 [Cichorium endivia]|nr:hypothetical protein L1887_54141 [Cichorium endivia]
MRKLGHIVARHGERKVVGVRDHADRHGRLARARGRQHVIAVRLVVTKAHRLGRTGDVGSHVILAEGPVVELAQKRVVGQIRDAVLGGGVEHLEEDLGAVRALDAAHFAMDLAELRLKVGMLLLLEAQPRDRAGGGIAERPVALGAHRDGHKDRHTLVLVSAAGVDAFRGDTERTGENGQGDIVEGEVELLVAICLTNHLDVVHVDALAVAVAPAGDTLALLLVEERFAAAEVETANEVEAVADGAPGRWLVLALSGALVLCGVGVDLPLDITDANALLECTESSVVALNHPLTIGEAVVDLDHQGAAAAVGSVEAIDQKRAPDGLGVVVVAAEEVSGELVERDVIATVGALRNVLDVLLDVEIGHEAPAGGRKERACLETLAVAGATPRIKFATRRRSAWHATQSLLLLLLGKLGVEIDDVAVLGVGLGEHLEEVLDRLDVELGLEHVDGEARGGVRVVLHEKRDVVDTGHLVKVRLDRRALTEFGRLSVCGTEVAFAGFARLLRRGKLRFLAPSEGRALCCSCADMRLFTEGGLGGLRGSLVVTAVALGRAALLVVIDERRVRRARRLLRADTAGGSAAGLCLAVSGVRNPSHLAIGSFTQTSALLGSRASTMQRCRGVGHVGVDGEWTGRASWALRRGLDLASRGGSRADR